ncbi:MAG: 30S ribosomal protein S2 [Nanoarchaeota archaeon]
MPRKKKEEELLISFEEYKKSGAYIGTRVVTGHMQEYVYKRRADGLAIINTAKIDEKVKLTSRFLTQYEPKDILIVCKREAGWQAVEKFSALFGMRHFTRRYPAGVITNPSLPSFFEPKMLLIVDPWTDKNAMHDALKLGIPIFALCDTNNVTNYIDLVIPCNNKAKSSIALVFWILANEYAKFKGLAIEVKLEDFGYEAKEELEKEKAGTEGAREMRVVKVRDLAKEGV